MLRSHLQTGLRLRSLTPLLTALLFLAGSALAAQETVIQPFNNANGFDPVSGPVADEAGNLYGTTFTGGKDECGTVYRLSAPAQMGGAWTKTAFYSFHCGADGGLPYGGLIFDKRGNLYGTTTLGGGGSCLGGCGTVFELVRPTKKGHRWTKSILYTFQGGTTDGSYPEASLAFDTQGNLYGTSLLGGGSECGGRGCGTVYELSPPQQEGGAWSEAVLHTFVVGVPSTDGTEPSCNLIFDTAGNLYGTTGGGGSYNAGAIFELSPPATKGEAWSETVIYSFIGLPDGSNPMAGLVLAPGGVFYGTASGLGPSLGGTVFELAPPAQMGGAWTETVLHGFTLGADGGSPLASVVLDAAGNLYGTTLIGGNYSCDPGVFVYGCGVVYKLAPPAVEGEEWTETILHNFSGGGDGIQPLGGLTFGKFGLLYGTTEEGGPSGAGTVFSVTR